MNINNILTKYFFVVAVILVLPHVILAMESANYKIPSDSLNVGGLNSSSASYATQDTIGEVATGESSSASYKLKAGFQQMQEGYISITPGSSVSLPNMSGLTGGTSDGTESWTVKTDNAAGYTLTIRAATSPALAGTLGSFPDYVPAGANPDYTFAVSASTAAFGFSPEGTDIVAKYKDDGLSCNTGSLDTADACWDGLSTSDITIAQRTSANHPSGTATAVKFKAQSGSSNIQPADSYSASVTLTALAL